MKHRRAVARGARRPGLRAALWRAWLPSPSQGCPRPSPRLTSARREALLEKSPVPARGPRGPPLPKPAFWAKTRSTTTPIDSPMRGLRRVAGTRACRLDEITASRCRHRQQHDGVGNRLSSGSAAAHITSGRRLTGGPDRRSRASAKLPVMKSRDHRDHMMASRWVCQRRARSASGHAATIRARGTLMALAIVAASALPAAAFAQSITFYEYEGFGGRRIDADHALPDFEPTGLNDATNAIIVRYGQWIVCTDAYFRGRCMTFGPGEYSNLGAYDLSRSISSARMLGAEGDVGPSPQTI